MQLVCYHTVSRFGGREAMARNKNPEETVNKILDVSYRLFMEKGYEYTSIQEIIDSWGDLARGLFTIILSRKRIFWWQLQTG